jgi:hypothetical protein
MKPGDTWTVTQYFSAVATGTPIGVLYHNGTSDAAVVTVSQIGSSAGYTFSVTIPTSGSYVEGVTIEMAATATASGATQTQVIARDYIHLLNSADVPATVWNAARSSFRQAGSFGAVLQGIRDGMAQGGSANTITLDSGAPSTTNVFANMLFEIVAGTGIGQALYCKSYNGATKVATMYGSWPLPPDSTSQFCIQFGDNIPGGPPATAQQIAAMILATPANLLQTDGTGRVTVGTNADKASYGLAATQSYNNTGQTNNLPANATQLAGQTITCAAGVTIPATISSYAGGAVASVTAPVTAGTVTDKTGYSLSTADHTLISGTDVPAALTAQGYTGARATKIDNLDAAVSTRSTFSGGAVASVTGAVGSVTGSVGSVVGGVGSVTSPVTVGTNSDKTGYSLLQAFPPNFSTLGISGAGKINGVALVDTLTTYTGNTPQTGDLFAVVNPMITSKVFTTASLVNAPAGGGGSFPIAAPANWLTSTAFASGVLPANFGSLGITAVGKVSEVVLTDTATAVTNPVATGTPASGVTVIGSTNVSVTLSGLPAGKTYAVTGGANNQRLLHGPSGEARSIATQAVSGGNYIFTFGTGSVEAGPFSANPATGDLFYPLP